MLLSLLPAVVACAAYRAVPLEPHQTSAAFAARRLDDPALKPQIERLLPRDSAAWPPPEWDRAQLLAVALLQNPDLAVSSARIGAAQAGEIAAGEAPNPDLTLESEYARHDTRPWLYGLALDWPLIAPTQRRLRREVARRETINERLQFMEDAWTVRRQLIGALTISQGAQRSLALLDELAATQEHLIEIANKRVAAGEEAPAEIVALEQVRTDTETQRVQVRGRTAAAQALSAKALGVTPQALAGTKIAWPEWGTPPTLDDKSWRSAREQALLSRSDLAIAIGDYAIAEARLELALARQYPQLAIGPGYYWDHGIAKFPFDLGLSLPLNQNRGEIAEARAARDLAGRRMLAAQADILGAIAANQRAEQLAREALAAAEQQLAMAKRLEARNELELRVGERGTDDSLVGHLGVLRAELGVVEAQAQLQEARNDLEDSLHVPLSGPELALVQAP